MESDEPKKKRKTRFMSQRSGRTPIPNYKSSQMCFAQTYLRGLDFPEEFFINITSRVLTLHLLRRRASHEKMIVENDMLIAYFHVTKFSYCRNVIFEMSAPRKSEIVTSMPLNTGNQFLFSTGIIF